MARDRNPNDTTKILSYIVVAVIAFLSGFLLNKLTGNVTGEQAETAKQGSAAAPSGGEAGDSSKIPIGDSPVLGPENAPVTIVEFSDFECPFCQKGYNTINKVKENYPENVRVVFKQFPLPMHSKAKPAARVALAAREQGDEYFWKMHDKLFEKQKEWKGKNVEEIAVGWADGMGLDVEQLKKDLKNNESKYNEIIDSEKKLGQKLGVKGTPHFFVNGKALSGAQPFNKFENLIDNQIEQTQKMLEGGVAKSELYEKVVAKNFDSPSGNDGQNDKKGKKKETKVEYVPVDDSDPAHGASADEALVTFVEFSDFECPFCNKALPTLDKLREKYDDKVRFVFKHRPLGFHDNAKPAARAAIAAQEQGKFWEMHELLFKNQKQLGNDGAYANFAEQLGLNVDKFKSDMESEATKKKLQSDISLAQEVGANGTPNFWINGVNVVGAQPLGKFESVIKEQIKRAEKVQDEEGASGEKLYKAVAELNKSKIGSAGGGADKPSKGQGKDAPTVDTDSLEIGESPVKGPKDAPITMYEFSDFECPFCKKAHSSVKKLLDNYGDKIRLVHKHYPLPMHSNAKPAARAGMAAQKQGKFWEMYDIMYENQGKLGQDGIFAKWAGQIGMDVEQFKSDMESAPDSRISNDMEMGKGVGVKGTPAFFINGKRLVGAQPYSKFKSIVEKELE